jgi:hypothetical protein
MFQLKVDYLSLTRHLHQPAGPGKPVGPYGPDAPVAPLAPVAPTCPGLPKSPVAPVAPAGPDDPVTPAAKRQVARCDFSYLCQKQSIKLRLANAIIRTSG